MKKAFVFLSITLCSVSLLIAKPVILKVLDYKDTSSLSAYNASINIWDAFEKSHPDIIIQREVLYSDGYEKRLNDHIRNNTVPDVFFLFSENSNNPYGSMIHKEKLAKDLTIFLENDGLKDKHSKNMLNPSLFSENYISFMPYGNVVPGLVFANKKLLEDFGLEPAKTYEELVNQIPILEKHGIKLVSMANKEEWLLEACIFSTVAGRIMGPTWAKEIKENHMKFTNEKFVSTVNFMKKLFDDKVILIDSFNMNIDESVYEFANFKSAYFINCDNITNYFTSGWYEEEAIIPEDVQLNDIEIIPFPKIPEEQYAESCAAVLNGGYAMSATIEEGSEKEKAAWELIKWLSGPEVQQYYMNNSLSYPTLTEGLSYSQIEPIEIKRSDMCQSIVTYTPIYEFEFDENLTLAIFDGLKALALGHTNARYVCEVLQDFYESKENWFDYENIFDTSLPSIEKDEDSNEPVSNKILKTIEGELTSIVYEIRQTSKGDVTIFISDELLEDYIVIDVDSVDVAFNVVYAIEEDITNMYKKDFWGTLMQGDSPVKTVIHLLMDVDEDMKHYSWKQFSDTGEYYFSYDFRY